MPTTHAPPRLPGARATTLFLIGGLVLWAFLLLFLLLLVPLIGLMTVEATQAGGHLPWPVAHWALTTPAGLVGILAICVGVGAPAFIAGQRHFLRGWTLARAVDVTAVPPWVWLTRPPVYPGETRADRWLGRSRSAQLVSLTLLGGAVLICLLLVEIFLAAVVVTLRSIPHPPCGVGVVCPPIYPLIPMGLVSEWVIMGLSYFAQYRWLRRVEASSGVWLRYRTRSVLHSSAGGHAGGRRGRPRALCPCRGDAAGPRVRLPRVGGTPAYAGDFRRRLPAILAPNAVATGIRCFEPACNVLVRKCLASPSLG